MIPIIMISEIPFPIPFVCYLLTQPHNKHGPCGEDNHGGHSGEVLVKKPLQAADNAGW